MEASSRSRLVRAEQREEERVTPLELFFDLVFVLALTQCTALMAKTPVWEGLVKGLLVLGVLWWAWVGYAWLTSVVDPEAGAVRLAIFAAMAGYLVAALAIPNAFGDDGLIFAAAYAFVRIAHIWLFTIASREDPGLRRSVVGLGVSTSVGVTLLLVASATDGALQLVLWGLALGLDAAGPYLIGADGWKLMPAHFAERHGLILIIALGESIVAIGVGSNAVVDTGVIVAAGVGIGIAAAQWWIYFDVTVWVAERQFTEMDPGRDQNELARDAYSYIHFAMVAGIVLVALGAKKTLEHVGDDLETVPAVALVGGAAVYLLGLVAFRLRIRRTLSRTRLVGALILIAALPLGLVLPALATLAIVLAVLLGLIVYEFFAYREFRERVRHQLARDHGEEAAPA